MTGPMMIANSLTLFLSFSLSPPPFSLSHTLSHSLITILSIIISRFFFYSLFLPTTFRNSSLLRICSKFSQIFTTFYFSFRQCSSAFFLLFFSFLSFFNLFSSSTSSFPLFLFLFLHDQYANYADS